MSDLYDVGEIVTREWLFVGLEEHQEWRWGGLHSIMKDLCKSKDTNWGNWYYGKDRLSEVLRGEENKAYEITVMNRWRDKRKIWAVHSGMSDIMLSAENMLDVT